MSRSSGYLAGKKSRHGTQTERKRARTLYIMKTQTAELAEMVAASVKAIVIEEVTRELDRRGYRNREDGGIFAEGLQDLGAEINPEAPGPVEEA